MRCLTIFRRRATSTQSGPILSPTERRLRKDGRIPLPDHGKPGDSVALGTFYDYDLRYLQNTFPKDSRCAEYGKLGVIESVAPKAHEHGMDFFAWDLNNARTARDHAIPNFVDVSEIDVYDRRTTGPCFRGHRTAGAIRGASIEVTCGSI